MLPAGMSFIMPDIFPIISVIWFDIAHHAAHHLAVLHHAVMLAHLVMMHGAALVFHHPTAHLSECERAAQKQNKNADCGYCLLHFVDVHSL